MKDIIEPLVRKGLSNQEIVKQTGIKYGTVWAAAKPVREEMEKYIGKNADRHLCETCKFRMTGAVKNNGAKCDYLSAKKHSRGCTVEDCSVYEKGEPTEKKKKNGFKTAYV